MPVYLLHFSERFHHAGHYLGFAEDLEARLERHRAGRGARLVEVITEAGLDFQLVRTWNGDRVLERQLKRQKNGPRLCPICKGFADKGEKPSPTDEP
ncbi:MAG: hypothetical protein Fur0022_02170 [Anaerolineales bacterium]